MCGFEIDTWPHVQIHSFDGSIEVLQLDGVVFFVDGDNLEEITVQSLVPTPYFRGGVSGKILTFSTALKRPTTSSEKTRTTGAERTTSES